MHFAFSHFAILHFRILPFALCHIVRFAFCVCRIWSCPVMLSCPAEGYNFPENLRQPYRVFWIHPESGRFINAPPKGQWAARFALYLCIPRFASLALR